LYLTIRHAARLLTGRLRSRLTASSLGNPRGFWIGGGATIIGAKHIKIGQRFVAGSHLWLEAVSSHRGVLYRPQIDIGNNVTMGDLVRMSANSRVRIGNNVLMGSKIYISDHNHGEYAGAAASDPRKSPHERPLSPGREVRIDDMAWIGESTTILAGVTIGEGSVIGANSVVTSSIPAYSIAAGNPARILKQFDASTLTWLPIERPRTVG
jgi:lipopolysaccharide O-acetyltransferase